jgi:hypothetical protein
MSCSTAANNYCHLVVVAASPDSKAAKPLRNDIRSRIAAKRKFECLQSEELHASTEV